MANARAIPTANVRSALRTRRSNAPASDGSGELGSGELRSRPPARARVVGAALGSRRSARARAVGASLAETWHPTRALLDAPRRYFPKRLEVVAGALVMRGEAATRLSVPPRRAGAVKARARAVHNMLDRSRVCGARGALRSSDRGAWTFARERKSGDSADRGGSARTDCSVTGRGMTNSHDNSHRHPHWLQ